MQCVQGNSSGCLPGLAMLSHYNHTVSLSLRSGKGKGLEDDTIAEKEIAPPWELLYWAVTLSPAPRASWTYHFNHLSFLEATCERTSRHQLRGCTTERGQTPPVWMMERVTNHWSPSTNDSGGLQNSVPSCQAQGQRSARGLPRAGGSGPWQVQIFYPSAAQSMAGRWLWGGSGAQWGSALMTGWLPFPRSPNRNNLAALAATPPGPLQGSFLVRTGFIKLHNSCFVPLRCKRSEWTQ